MRLSQASKSGVLLTANEAASRRTSALCSSSTMSFFLHHLGHGQITELLADPHQLIHHRFELPHGLNLLAINRNQLRISQAHGAGLASFLAGDQRIRAASDLRAICMFDRQELFGERAATQLSQAGQLLEKGLTLVFQVWVSGGSNFHIVAILLQYTGPKTTQNLKTHFYLVHPLSCSCFCS